MNFYSDVIIYPERFDMINELIFSDEICIVVPNSNSRWKFGYYIGFFASCYVTSEGNYLFSLRDNYPENNINSCAYYKNFDLEDIASIRVIKEIA